VIIYIVKTMYSWFLIIGYKGYKILIKILNDQVVLCKLRPLHTLCIRYASFQYIKYLKYRASFACFIKIFNQLQIMY
jgi:hypothetical protein